MGSCPAARKANGGKGSIAEQLVDNKIDVLLGGGRNRFTQNIDAGGTLLARSTGTLGYREVTDKQGLAGLDFAGRRAGARPVRHRLHDDQVRAARGHRRGQRVDDVPLLDQQPRRSADAGRDDDEGARAGGQPERVLHAGRERADRQGRARRQRLRLARPGDRGRQGARGDARVPAHAPGHADRHHRRSRPRDADRAGRRGEGVRHAADRGRLADPRRLQHVDLRPVAHRHAGADRREGPAGGEHPRHARPDRALPGAQGPRARRHRRGGAGHDRDRRSGGQRQRLAHDRPGDDHADRHGRDPRSPRPSSASNGGAWTPYTAPVQVAAAGTTTIEYRSTDSAGNVETIRSRREDRLHRADRDGRAEPGRAGRRRDVQHAGPGDVDRRRRGRLGHRQGRVPLRDRRVEHVRRTVHGLHQRRARDRVPAGRPGRERRHGRDGALHHRGALGHARVLRGVEQRRVRRRPRSIPSGACCGRPRRATR